MKTAHNTGQASRGKEIFEKRKGKMGKARVACGRGKVQTWKVESGRWEGETWKVGRFERAKVERCRLQVEGGKVAGTSGGCWTARFMWSRQNVIWQSSNSLESPPRSTCHLPRSTCHVPPAMFGLPLCTFHLSTFHLPPFHVHTFPRPQATHAQCLVPSPNHQFPISSSLGRPSGPLDHTS